MKKWDYILIASLIIISVSWIALLIFSKQQGDKVVVRINNDIVYTCPLNEDNEYLLEHGDDYNLLIVKDGEATIDDANCPGLDCVKSASISKDGESIICIPHSLIVTIESETDNNIDFISE